MFHFKKRDKDKKEKEKKEKKDKRDKGGDKNVLTEDELARLEEAKKGMFRSEKGRVDDRQKDSSLDKRSHLSKPLPPPVAAKTGKPSSKVKTLSKGAKPEQAKFYPLEDSNDKTQSNISNNAIVDPDATLTAESDTITNDNKDESLTNGISDESTTSTIKAKNKPNLHLPDIIPPKPARTRTLLIPRLTTGDFGFTLRKGVMMEHTNGSPNRKRVVIFAEPGSGHNTTVSGLLPGDRLIEVNGENVESTPRDEIIDMVKNSSDAVSLTVQTISELIELSVRPAPGGHMVDIGDEMMKAGSLKHTSNTIQTKIPEKAADTTTWHESEAVWLVHRGGFTAAKLLKSSVTSPLPDGIVKVKLDQNGDVIDVSDADIEKANPPQNDKSEDLSALRYLNESSVLHTVRQRYGSSLVHTYAGPNLLVVNPASTLSIYSDKVIQMFRGCQQEDMPPHIYSSAQVAHHEMLSSRRDQSIILIGRSGGGKTTNARHLLHYLTAAFSSDNTVFSVTKLHSIVTLLESFGNSRTIMNTNASRFSQVTSLQFDHLGHIVSASIQALMFDKCRVTTRPEGEPTFHIFYQLLAGVDSQLRKELELTVLNEPNLFFTPLQRAEDRQRATQSFNKVVTAMEGLGINEAERKAIFSVVSAIYHLGVAGITKGTNNKPQFAKPASAQRAASLLGISIDDLIKSVFNVKGTSSGLSRSSSFMGGTDKGQNDQAAATWTLEGFVIGLYNDLFNVIVALINRCMQSNARSVSSINIVDTPGFQNPATCGRQTGATFEDLCYNYTQERLQLLYHDITFTSHQDKYAQENIKCDFEFVTTSPAAVVSFLDRPAQQAVGRSSTTDVRNSADKRGLLWLLDEEAIFPGSTEDTFMERLFICHADNPITKESLLRKGSLGQQFVINHLQGTNPVQYNANNWLTVCRERPTTKLSTPLLQESSRDQVKQLFGHLRGSSLHSGSVAGSDSSANLRRATSMRRTYLSGSAALKRKSLCLQVKFQVDGLMDLLHKTKCHFVHCLLPQHNAGLCDLKLPNRNESQDDLLINVPLLRTQLRGAELLDAVRIHRHGFPESIPFKDFMNRFHVLQSTSEQTLEGDSDERQAVSSLLEHLEIDQLNYRTGQSLVFFRSGVLSQLETVREQKIAGSVVKFQAVCRGYLGRKYLKKLRVQEMAVKCVQKNIRKYMLLRDWSWWWLYTRVKPLINVHRTEDLLKEAEIELEQFKAKFEKVEKERNDLKLHSNSLENQLAEVTADLSEETATNTNATEMLEIETAERLRLEKELNDLLSKYNGMKQKGDKLEMELMQTKLWQNSTSFDESDDENDGNDSIYKERYTKLLREMNFNKKQLEQQHIDDLEEEKLNRKAVERRLNEVQEELETQRRNIQQEKRKSQRFVTEKQDMTLHLEEQMKRNNELEKKQKRFDSELGKIQEDVKQERTTREKYQRERDELSTDTLSLENELKKNKLNLEEEREKVEQLDRELKDLLSSGSKGDTELVTVKRMRQELENKVRDQEEELDEQASQIEMLQQTKLRLEMHGEKSRQTHVKEMDEKEVEMEELRFNTQKRVKNIENQMEEEHSERQRVQREKRELESKLKDMTNLSPQRDRGLEKRLRKDLHQTKALLRDAEVMLQKGQGGEASRNNLRQLRNQLEDVQFSMNTAVKAKKGLEGEVHDLQQQMEALSRSKQSAEDKCMAALKEQSDTTSQLEENDEDMSELMKKYKALVQQQSVDHMTMTHQLQQIEDLVQERDTLREQMSELKTHIENIEENSVDKHIAARLEIRVKDLETKLEYEQTLRQRLEVQTARVKEQTEQVTKQKDDSNLARQQSEEITKRLQRQISDLRDELGDLSKREMEAAQARSELEVKLDQTQNEYEQNRSDLKLAFKRIADLQAALEAEIESDDSLLMDSDEMDSEDEDDDLSQYLRHPHVTHNRSLGSIGSSRHSHANSSFTDVGISVESPGMESPGLYLEDCTWSERRRDEKRLDYTTVTGMAATIVEEFVFKVDFIGSAMVGKDGSGLSSIQKPLKELYIDSVKKAGGSPRSQERHLKIRPEGVLMTFRDGTGQTRHAFYDLASIQYFEAVKFSAVRGSDKKLRALFEPISSDSKLKMTCSPIILDKKFSHLADRHHPPMFACVIRRHSSVKAVDCFVFITSDDDDALQLASLISKNKYEPRIGGGGDVRRLNSSQSSSYRPSECMSERRNSNISYSHVTSHVSSQHKYDLHDDHFQQRSGEFDAPVKDDGYLYPYPNNNDPSMANHEVSRRHDETDDRRRPMSMEDYNSRRDDANRSRILSDDSPTYRDFETTPSRKSIHGEDNLSGYRVHLSEPAPQKPKTEETFGPVCSMSNLESRQEMEKSHHEVNEPTSMDDSTKGRPVAKVPPHLVAGVKVLPTAFKPKMLSPDASPVPDRAATPKRHSEFSTHEHYHEIGESKPRSISVDAARDHGPGPGPGRREQWRDYERHTPGRDRHVNDRPREPLDKRYSTHDTEFAAYAAKREMVHNPYNSSRSNDPAWDQRHKPDPCPNSRQPLHATHSTNPHASWSPHDNHPAHKSNVEQIGFNYLSVGDSRQDRSGETSRGYSDVSRSYTDTSRGHADPSRPPLDQPRGHPAHDYPHHSPAPRPAPRPSPASKYEYSQDREAGDAREKSGAMEHSLGYLP